MSPATLKRWLMSIHKRGQSTVEFAVFTCAAVSAILMMAIYIKRGMAGSLRNAADAIGEQYEPRKTTGVTVTRNAGGTTTTRTRLLPGTVNGQPVLISQSKTTMSAPQQTGNISEEKVGPMGTDLWK